MNVGGISKLAVIGAVLGYGATGLAANGLAVGDRVQGFALKAVNSDTIGENLVAIDNYFGPEAKTPKKAILLSFFATYCEPCKKEMPFLAALYDEYGGKGLSVMSVSIDRDSDKVEFVKSLAADSGVKFPVLTDRFNIVAKRYYVEKLPLVYLIDGQGRIAMIKTGYTEDATRTIFDEVRRILGEPSSGPVPGALASHLGVAPEPTPIAAEANVDTESAEEGPQAEVKAAAGEKRKKKRRGGKRRRWKKRR